MKPKIDNVWIETTRSSDRKTAYSVHITFWRNDKLSSGHAHTWFRNKQISKASIKRARRAFKQLQAKTKAKAK